MKYLINTFIYINLFLFLSLGSLTAQEISFDCFTIIVGKEASSDGSLKVSHNEDDNGKQIVNLYKTDSKTHSPNDFVTFNNSGIIKQVSKTNGFIWMQLPGMKVADSFINNYGVVVTSNGCPSREESPDSTDGGVLYWLRRLVAERAKSSKEGVKIAGNLIDTYGYVSSGRTYTIADKNEAWVLSAVYGKHWVAQRVPDDQIAIIPNYYTIREVNLKDTLNFLGSPDIETYAIKKGWYDPKSNKKFDFAEAYTARTSINHPGNINRIWRGINYLSDKEFKIDEKFPFSFSSFKKVDIQDIMTILRDHYETCEFDKTEMYKNGDPHYKNEATICSESTQYSFIAQLRNDMPVEIGTLIWYTYFRPCISYYAPMYLGIKSFPEDFAYTNSENAIKEHLNPKEEIFDSTSGLVYWDFVSAANKINKNFEGLFPPNRNRNQFIQNELIRKTKIFETDAMKTYSENPTAAFEKIDEFSRKSLNDLHLNAKKIWN